VLKTLRPRCRANTYFGAVVECDRRDFIQARIAHFGVWEPDISAVFEELVRPGDIVLDVGANIGYFSLLASQLTGPSGLVVAVEAWPATVKLLEENIRTNGCDNIRVVNIAASASPGRLTLYPGPGNNIGRVSMTEQIKTFGGRPLVVEAQPLDALLSPEELRRVSVIKIDVEGGERPILERLLDTLDLYSERLSILVEIVPAGEPETWLAIFHRLREAGFSATAIRNDYGFGSYLRRPEGPAALAISRPPDHQTDVLFTRKHALH
jgi:FkbM family methyltransferase